MRSRPVRTLLRNTFIVCLMVTGSGCQDAGGDLAEAWRRWDEAGFPRSLREREPAPLPSEQNAADAWRRVFLLLPDADRQDQIHAAHDDAGLEAHEHLTEELANFARMAMTASTISDCVWDRSIYHSELAFEHEIDWIAPANQSVRLLLRHGDSLRMLDRHAESEQTILAALALSRHICAEPLFPTFQVSMRLDDLLFRWVEKYGQFGAARRDLLIKELSARHYPALLSESVLRYTILNLPLFTNRSFDEQMQFGAQSLREIRSSVPRYASIRACDTAAYLDHQRKLIQRLNAEPLDAFETDIPYAWPGCALLARALSAEPTVQRIKEPLTELNQLRLSLIELNQSSDDPSGD